MYFSNEDINYKYLCDRYKKKYTRIKKFLKKTVRCSVDKLRKK